MPEQFLWIKFLKKYINIDYDHRDYVTYKNIILTERTFANNLVLLEKEKLGIEALKYDLFTKGDVRNCFSFDE
jgi:hypothetical protein